MRINKMFMSVQEREEAEFRCSTDAEIIADWTSRIGSNDPDQAWILSPYDTWERNPHYDGPSAPHPESEEYEDYGELEVREDTAEF